MRPVACVLLEEHAAAFVLWLGGSVSKCLDTGTSDARCGCGQGLLLGMWEHYEAMFRAARRVCRVGRQWMQQGPRIRWSLSASREPRAGRYTPNNSADPR